MRKAYLKKNNHTAPFMKYYISTSNMPNKAIRLSVFIDKVLFKYSVE